MSYCMTGPAQGSGPKHVHAVACCSSCAKGALGDDAPMDIVKQRALEATADWVHDPNGARDRLIQVLRYLPGVARNHAARYVLNAGRPRSIVEAAIEATGGWAKESSLVPPLLAASAVMAVGAYLLARM